MGSVYKSICYEADTLLLLATRLAEKEIQLKVDIEKLMNDGFVNIAKARYIMGSTCVTKMQLPTGNSNPIKALATVGRREVNNNWVFYILRENNQKNTELSGVDSKDLGESLEVDYGSDNTNEMSNSYLAKSEAAFKNLLQNDPKSLKKSKNAFLIDDNLYQEYNDELLDEMSNSGSEESLVSVTDPIRLFGILVPNVLKEAQVIFNDVINLLGECATVQSELKETLDKFSHLIKVKKLIEAASEEMRLDILTPKVYWTPSKTSSISCYSLKSAEGGEGEGPYEVSNISIQKSIRSVFYDEEDVEPQETDITLWGSDDNERGSNDN